MSSILLFLAQSNLPFGLQYELVKFCRYQTKTLRLRACGSGVEVESYDIQPGDRVLDLFVKNKWKYVYLDKDGKVLYPGVELTEQLQVFVLEKEWHFPKWQDSDKLKIPNPPEFAFYAGFQKRDREWSHSPCGKWRGQKRSELNWSGREKQYIVVETLDTHEYVLRTTSDANRDIQDYLFYGDRLIVTFVGSNYGAVYCLPFGPMEKVEFGGTLSICRGLLQADNNLRTEKSDVFNRKLQRIQTAKTYATSLFGQEVSLPVGRFCTLDIVYAVAKFIATQTREDDDNDDDGGTLPPCWNPDYADHDNDW